jgi:hypothetical protein
MLPGRSRSTFDADHEMRGGEKFVVTAAAMPTRFKADGRMGVVLGLVERAT